MIGSREFRAAALGAGVIALYMALVLASGRVDPAMFGRLLLFYVGLSFAIWSMLGGAWLLFASIRDDRAGTSRPLIERLKHEVRERRARDGCTSLLWPPLLFATLLSTFNAFKQMILPMAGFGWDPFLAQADRALFLGTDPWRLTHALLGAPAMTVLIDHVYHGWFVPMSLGLVACAWMPASTFRLRTQYMLSYIGVWIGIGSVMAFAMPSSGPCFYNSFHLPSASFAELLDRLGAAQAAAGTPLTSLPNQAMLAQSFGIDQLAVGGGISAMPSVHNALAMLFALAASRLNRTAGRIVAAYAGLIWIGSVHLGWHYALDGLVAFVLTWGLWALCGRIAVALDHQGAPRKAVTALV